MLVMRSSILLLLLATSVLAEDEYSWTLSNHDYPKQDLRISGHSIGSQKLGVKLETQCSVYCERTAGCRSFNFHSLDEICALNSVDASTTGAQTRDAGWQLFAADTFTISSAAKTPCQLQPCKNDGNCSDWTDENGVQKYMCLCTDGWSGKDCSDQEQADWADWEEWSECSVSCGAGYKIRSRKCVNPVSGEERSDSECFGHATEMKDCVYKPCPEWDQWSDYSDCSTSLSCGVGTKLKQRTCLNGGAAGVDRMCMGPAEQTEVCEQPMCGAPVRLVGSDNSGSVEVYDSLRSEWVAVCSDSWDQNDGDVLCKQLGYYKGAGSVDSETVDPPSGSWGLSAFGCTGSEESLVECTHSQWHSDVQCQSGKAAAVNCIVDGGWGAWSAWDDCSVSCDEGSQQRTRTCNYPSPANGGSGCPDSSTESMDCTGPPCPEDGTWLTWSTWGSCSKECGGGEQTRTRECSGIKHGGKPCAGEGAETVSCNDQPCPVDGFWLEWQGWGDCSRSCGGGVQIRSRACHEPLHEGKPCEGNDEEQVSCNENSCPIHGLWSPWSEWSQCSMSCAFGVQKRTRQCSDPAPQHGGRLCDGRMSEQQEESCILLPCPVDGGYTEWGSWSDCSKSCDGGQQTRSRTCTEPAPQFGGAECNGAANETVSCKTDPCPIDGVWTTWTEWSECSQTCDEGERQRTRECDGPFHGGKMCEGPTEEIEPCKERNCAEDGNWSEWGAWETCTATCGNGQQRRTRTCTEPPPKNGGRKCGAQYNSDSEEDIQECQMPPCPQDGSWSNWSPWEPCSVTCGQGSKQRTRACTNPPPANGGLLCDGEYSEVDDCNDVECPIDGQWSKWGEWTMCDATCESEGTQTRTRQCDNPSPQHNGKICPESPSQTAPCTKRDCAVDGNWSNWGDWTTWSASCGRAVRQRTRECNNPKPQGGGLGCLGGDSSSTSADNKDFGNCPVDGNWATWSSWSTCTVTCDGGKQQRNRECSDPAPENGGMECAGLGLEEVECNTDRCPRPGDWKEWSEWDPCSQTCDGGQRTRTRECDTESHGEYGVYTLDCEGDSRETIVCNDFDCESIRTCHEAVELGLEEDSYIFIRPDYNDIEVFCNITTGQSVVHHTFRDEWRLVEGYEGREEWRWEVEYVDSSGSTISAGDLGALVDNSEGCKQFISWRCANATINRQENGTDSDSTGTNANVLTTWRNRNDQEPLFFGGASPEEACLDDMSPYTVEGSLKNYVYTHAGSAGKMLCACGLTKTCTNPDLLCNCDDSENKEWSEDAGYITDRCQLPVMQYNAGDTGGIQKGATDETQGEEERGKAFLGPLICWGSGLPPGY